VEALQDGVVEAVAAAAHRDLDPDRAAAAREHQRRVLCYPLKDRMLDLDDFLGARSRVVAGGSALDPEVVRRVIRPRDERLTRLTPGERDVLALMAEGRTNVGIAKRLDLSERTVERHVANIVMKLDLASGEDDHRRVLADVASLPDVDRAESAIAPRRRAERPAPEPSGRFWRRHCCGLTS